MPFSIRSLNFDRYQQLSCTSAVHGFLRSIYNNFLVLVPVLLSKSVIEVANSHFVNLIEGNLKKDEKQIWEISEVEEDSLFDSVILPHRIRIVSLLIIHQSSMKYVDINLIVPVDCLISARSMSNQPDRYTQSILLLSSRKFSKVDYTTKVIFSSTCVISIPVRSLIEYLVQSNSFSTKY